MPVSEWVAIDATTDRRSRAAELARIHHQALSGEAVRGALRELVRRSWARSSGAGVDPEHTRAPLVIGGDEAAARWDAHPLRVGAPLLLRLLEDLAADGPQVALVCAADGTLLWLAGDRAASDEAAGIHLAPGALWSEAGAGTNAMGTALAVDHSLQIFSAEHFSSAVHGWTCTAAPVHDPETGELLGVLDVSGPIVTATPHSLALVTAAAHMIETVLALRAGDRDRALRERWAGQVGARRGQAAALVGPTGRVLASAREAWLGERLAVPADGGEVALGGAPAWAEPLAAGGGFLVFEERRTPGRRAPAALRLTGLGRDRIVLEDGEAGHTLSRRHSEILVLLATRPRGLTAEQLAVELHGDFGKPVTIRAEMSRLRGLLGERLLAAPYRLAGPVRTDFMALAERIGAAPLADVVADYPGPLLPRSEVPGVGEIRDWLDERLRSAVLASGDATALSAWLRGPGADDLVACHALLELVPADHPDRALGLSRLRRLRGLVA